MFAEKLDWKPSHLALKEGLSHWKCLRRILKDPRASLMFARSVFCGHSFQRLPRTRVLPNSLRLRTSSPPSAALMSIFLRPRGGEQSGPEKSGQTKPPVYSLLPSLCVQLPSETFFDLPESENTFCFTTCKPKCTPVIEYYSRGKHQREMFHES